MRPVRSKVRAGNALTDVSAALQLPFWTEVGPVPGPRPSRALRFYVTARDDPGPVYTADSSATQLHA